MEKEYEIFEKCVLNAVADIPLNLAKDSPAFVVKIVRIMENEKNLDVFLQQKCSQN